MIADSIYWLNRIVLKKGNSLTLNCALSPQKPRGAALNFSLTLLNKFASDLADIGEWPKANVDLPDL
jgi:hypothetical protein